MNSRVYLLLPLALSGCLQDNPTVVPQLSNAASNAERVYTVNEFLAQPELRKKYFSMCADNPGQTERDPNCINVLSAERIASAGTGIPHSVP